jgi:hypothetical protein
VLDPLGASDQRRRIGRELGHCADDRPHCLRRHHKQNCLGARGIVEITRDLDGFGELHAREEQALPLAR